jgi:hypothetical protein
MRARGGDRTAAERRERGNGAWRPWTSDGDERMRRAGEVPSSSSLAVDFHRFARLKTEEPSYKPKPILSVFYFLTNRSVLSISKPKFQQTE